MSVGSQENKRLIKEYLKAAEAISTSSSVLRHFNLPEYRAIIARGFDIVPDILEQLISEGDEPNHWFPALFFITGENPMSFEDRGVTIEMAQAWISWGKEHGYC